MSVKDYVEAEEWYNKGVEGIYKEGEEVIAKNEYWSHQYAKYEIKGRFILGEKAIKREMLYWDDYVIFLKRKGIEI